MFRLLSSSVVRPMPSRWREACGRQGVAVFLIADPIPASGILRYLPLDPHARRGRPRRRRVGPLFARA